jgi:F-type H+-transporting ATPase subunit c
MGLLGAILGAIMDAGTALALSAPLAIGLAALGSGFGLGKAVGSALEAIGRQPEAAGKIMTTMIIGAALIEALTIYALIVFFISLNRMQ